MTKALLYGTIGWDIQSKDVVAWLDENKDNQVEMHINSPGGDVFEAIAIRAAILAHNDITLVVDAMAASAAAIISLCGKPLKMAEYSRLMLHSASTYANGNKKEMEEQIAFLEGIDNDLASMIADKMGKEQKEILETYFDGNDHWLSAEECISMGIAEPAEEPKKQEEGVENKATALVWDCLNGKANNNFYNKMEQNNEQKQVQDNSEELEALKASGAEKDAKIAELEAKVAEFEAEKQKAQDEADEKIIAKAVEEQRCTEDQANIFRAMLKNDRENTLKMVDTLKAPEKPADVRDFMKGNGANGEHKKSSFEAELERIQNQK